MEELQKKLWALNQELYLARRKRPASQETENTIELLQDMKEDLEGKLYALEFKKYYRGENDGTEKNKD